MEQLAYPDATHGVVVVAGQSWGAHETGRVGVPLGTEPLILRVAYDEREAPYVVNPDGTEGGCLLSLSDEEGWLACAWEQPQSGSTLCGIGVDLASPNDFGPRPGTSRFVELIFSRRERELAKELYPDDVPLSYATLFAAKEAAFKAMARPLRTWYANHDEPLEFEVRDFGTEHLVDRVGLVQGKLRHGSAQLALHRMGISRIETRLASAHGLALVVAQAYR